MNESLRLPRAARWLPGLLALLNGACGGGGDGGTAPPTVASVVITAPAGAIAFQTFTRTSQLSAVARDAGGTTISGAAISWATSNAAAAAVSNAGIVTAVGNGTANITASSGGVISAPVAVTVTQYAAGVGQLPAAVAFGALGSTRQLGGAVADSSGAAVVGAPAVTWTRAGTGLVATVSPTGLVTSIGIGNTDTAVATAGTAVTRVPITVAQLITAVIVSPALPETLRTTGRTRQYTAAARDSNANTVAGAAFTWSSSSPSVATVGAGTGLATAVSDGNTQVTATTGGVGGSRPLHVIRVAQTFSLAPGSATITTDGGTQLFTGSALDSIGTALPLTWLSRTPTIAGVSPGSGLTTTATAVGNGTAYIVLSGGTRADSSLLTVTGQGAGIPLAADVTVGDSYFRSLRNSTQNEAVDTVGVGGTVTWTWVGSLSHSTQSTGAPSFPGSVVQTSGNFQFLFGAAGTYTYICSVHGASMSGRVVVR